jgi:O-methyltransferase involved in polyketide biosynthesis
MEISPLNALCRAHARFTLSKGTGEGPVSFLWKGLEHLREIAGLAAPGSQIVFRFIVPAVTLADEERSLVVALASLGAAAGEPWLSFFEPEELEAHLGQMGFGKVLRFGPGQATERYLLGRTDGLRLPAYFHMINACVG